MDISRFVTTSCEDSTTNKREAMDAIQRKIRQVQRMA